MPPRYCLPIIKTSASEVLDSINNNQANYSFFEVWLDYISDLDQSFIPKLQELLHERLIVLFRRLDFEPPRLNVQERLNILGQLDNSTVMVDLDVNQQSTELAYVQDQNLTLKLIGSYHDYQRTPDSVQLESIIDTMKQYQPTIYKLSTKCNSQQDALRLMELLLNLNADHLPAIILGMGDFGVITRIFGTLWGNEMIYAPQEVREQSAPGQLTRQQLGIIFKELGDVN